MDQAEFLASIQEAVVASGETADDTTEPAEDTQLQSGDLAEVPADAPTDSNDSDDADAGDENAAESSALDSASVAELLSSGDLAELCKRAGVDPKILKVNAGKLKADREILRQSKVAQAAAEARDKDAQSKLAEAKQILDGGRKTYGFAVDLKNMIASGDFLGIKELCMQLAPKGVTWEQINAGIIKAEKGDNPSEVMYRSLLRKQAQEKVEADRVAAEKAAQEAAANAEADQAKRNLESATAKLKGTQFEKIPGAAEKLVQIVNEAYDPVRKGFKITPAQALQQLAKDPLIALALKGLGGKPRVAEPLPARRNERGQFATPARDQKRAEKPTTKEAQRKQRDAEFAASIAEAAKLEAKERRNAGGARR
jgi:hypothetical protein